MQELLVKTIMALYEGAEMAVRTADSITDWFTVMVGLHWGSVFSPLLFITEMEVISREN